MSRSRLVALVIAGVLGGIGVFAPIASGQPVEMVGSRALGMAGAFVALADDATAVYWNPGGLAAGGFFGAQVDLHWLDAPRTSWSVGEGGLTDGRAAMVAVATLPLGFTYYQLVDSGRDLSREGVPGTAVALARLATHNAGVTLVQSLFAGVAVGATLKYVHGSAASGVATAATASDVRDAADDLESRSGHAFDADVGVHAVVNRFRVGLVVRNMFEPSFETVEGRELTTGRQARLGAAFRPTDSWVVAGDADLLEATSPTGEWRRAAVGVEHWRQANRVGLRGGLRWSTLGAARPVATGGASVAVRPGFFIEGHAAAGSSDAELAWGLSLRFGF